MATKKRKASTQLERNDELAVPSTGAHRTLLEVVDSERYFPIHQYLWSVLPVKTAVALSQTCRQLRAAHLRTFNINQRLSYFVRDPAGLRSQLGKNGALISGSFALQLLAQKRWPDSDLDIFVEAGATTEELHVYLQQIEHYRLKTTQTDGGYPMMLIKEVRTYHRSSSLDPSRAKIQLIVTQHAPMLGIMTGFYMTAVVNIISWNKAYAVFAKDTFIDNRTYMLQPLDAYFEGLLHKYNHRGRQLEEIMRREDHGQSTSIQPVRRLGDRFTWVVPLPTENVQPPPQADLVLESSTFAMYWNKVQPWQEPGYATCASYQISVKKFEHVGLKHQLIVASTGLDLDSQHPTWTDFLASRLNQHAKMQLIAMKPEERPEWFNQGLDDTDGMFLGLLELDDGVTIRSFKKPEGWKNFDEMIPLWFEQWLPGFRTDDCLFPTDG
ncbi:hypothetical protein H2200_010291 [Cladophialophora chaetospira]|uniref:Uncharacterized protein n=1 Tax=Cladophialophora chaetospira TaxID=386627 RepID=A0AA38X172_9EURO|nr:hypothetical protein H2200_010291 [Cladophialophora chaetospira]